MSPPPVGVRAIVLQRFHDFFIAATSVGGAFIGLLFVALSVAQEQRTDPAQHELHRLRAVGAFSAFSDALVISLWGLLPDTKMGVVCVSMAIVGLGSVTASVIAIIRMMRTGQRRRRRDGAFVASLLVIFSLQLGTGLVLLAHPADEAALNRVGDVVIVCFLVGAARAWELVGGPQIFIRAELAQLRRESQVNPAESAPDGPEKRTSQAASARS